MNTPLLPDDEFVRQMIPVVGQLLSSEFTHLPAHAPPAIQRQTLATCLNIYRKAQKKRLNLPLFVRRVVREQVLVWQAVQGTSSQQAIAMSQIMANNRAAVSAFLSSQRHKFRTTAIADELLSDSFQDFFKNLDRKPVTALLSTCVISIAKNKALQQLRNERTRPDEKWDWLETTFVTVDDAEIGSFTWPLTNTSEISTVALPAALAEATGKTRVDLLLLRQWVADCFSRLSESRQQLFRLRYKFWTENELETLPIDELEAIYVDQDMDQIAQKTGYKDASTANSRMTESRMRLRKCLTEKLTNVTV